MQKIIKIFFIFYFLFFIFNSAYASQKFEQLLLDSTSTWEEISFNYSNLAVDLYRNQQFDTLELLLDYWNEEFGLVEPLARFQILYDISTQTFTDSSFGMEIIDFLLDYKLYVETEIYHKDRSDPSLMTEDYYPFVSQRFDQFTVDLSDSLINQVHDNDSNFLLCEFYRNNFEGFFQKINSEKFSDTALKEYYSEYIKEILQQPESRFGISTGWWRPLGNNKILGNHPNVGGFYELKMGNWLLNLTLSLTFLDAKETYYVSRGNELIPTKDFFLACGGVELGQELLRYHSFSFMLLAGIGIDLLEAVNSEFEDEQVIIISPNMNMGTGLRFYTSRFRNNYFEFQYRINFVNYKNKNGSDLGGNADTFRLMFGFEFDSSKKRLLKTLGF